MLTTLTTLTTLRPARPPGSGGRPAHGTFRPPAEDAAMLRMATQTYDERLCRNTARRSLPGGAGTRRTTMAPRRKFAINTLLLLVVLAACDEPTAPERRQPEHPRISPIVNGHDMTNLRDARSGLVRIYITGANGFGSSCTASVLKSSQISDDAWLLTAAHCFYKVDYNDGCDQVFTDACDFDVHGAGSSFGVSVAYGADLGQTVWAGSDVFIHPEWAAHVDGGNGIWYDYPDVALVHFKTYVPVKNEDDYDYVEFTRPFFAGVMKDIEGDDVGVFGARGELRWARGQFAMSTNGYIVIDGSDWHTSDAVLEHGDSGGPWLYTDGGESSSEQYVTDGVVVGVTSGGHADASPLSWPPVDFFATGLSRPVVTDFLRNVTQNAVPSVDYLPWKRKPTLQYSANGSTAWTRLGRTSRNTGDVAIADFGPHACDQGSARDDVFLTENGRWWVSWCGTTEWVPIRESSTELDDKYRLAFGDFNGDRVTDVFRASGGAWKVSYSGTGSWTTIKASSTEVTDEYGLAFGDFNGDGVTDVFRASGGEWKVSFSGTGPWTTLKASTTELKDEYGLAFGDFDGDDVTDVFRASGGAWKVSYSGTGTWTTIKASATELTDEHGLLLGYFDQDNKTDVLRANGTEWRVSYGGVSSWTTLKTSSTTTRRLSVGDLADDNRSDVILTRNPTDCHTSIIDFCSRVFYHLNNTAPRR